MSKINEWEKEVLESLLDSEAAAIKELEAQYKRALKDINEKVKGFQADIDLLDQAMNQEGLDDNAKALLLSQKRSKIYQKQYQEALQGQVSGILDKMQADNYSTIDGYLKASYEDAYIGTMYDIAQQGVPVITPINQASAVQAILTDSKVVEGYYNLLGVSVSKLKKSISQEISRGIASGLLYSDIARNINNVSGSGLYNAKRIARTEGHRIQNTASRNAALEAKAHGADLVKVWDATLDGKTRPSHRKVDGEIKELNEKFSNGLDRPGDPSGSAAEVINCRCVELHKPRWDAEGAFLKRDNFTGEVLEFNSPKDYAEFKERYWSKENVAYMQKTAELQTKYGTKKYDKLLEKMSDREYEQFKTLEEASPMWKPKISSPINRNNANGKPRAVTMFDVELNNKQKSILEKLPDYNSKVIVTKSEVSMLDLSALTAKTGCEFAMFTRGSQRLIIRGNSYSVDVDIDKAKELVQNGYKWSGHTHPGTDMNSLIASGDDYEILKAFGQLQSVTFNSVGQYMVYELE